MNDVERLTPPGAGGESRSATIDLTRLDIRRGAIYLPRRFYGVLPEGEVKATDTSTGNQTALHFRPPRELQGLSGFFEEHDLRPNDALCLALSDELRLTPLRRERRQPGNPAAKPRQSAAPHEAPPSLEGRVSERVTVRRTEAPAERQTTQQQGQRQGAQPSSAERQPAQPSSAERQPAQPRPARDERSAQEETLSPRPESGGGWQKVLHDPGPPRGQAWQVSRSDPAADAEPSRQRSAPGEEKTAPGIRRPSRSPRQERLDPIDVGEGEPWHRTPRDLSRAAERKSRIGARPSLTRSRKPTAFERQESDAEPLAESPESTQEGLFEQKRAAERSADHHEVWSDEGAEVAGSPNPQADEAANADEAQRELVAVGGAAEGDLKGKIDGYLRQPGTPAIVRAPAVAQALGLSLEAAQQGLAEVSRSSEGKVTAIRPDVYLVKRGG